MNCKLQLQGFPVVHNNPFDLDDLLDARLSLEEHANERMLVKARNL